MKSTCLRIAAIAVAFALPACGDPLSQSLVTLSRSKLLFTGPEAGPSPANQTVQIAGKFGMATWTATTDQPWLTVSPASGTIRYGKNQDLTLHVELARGWVGSTSTVGAPFVDANTIAGWGAWTGSAMLIWGGDPAVPGKYYDPVSDTWFGATNTVGAPSQRSSHTAVWTGTEMIVWGGHSITPFVALNTGARYNPATDTWTPMSTVGAPSPRAGHRVVWTGTRMIVWGGDGLGYTYTNTGGIYDPVTDTWTGATSTVNAPSPRGSHAAAWTGTHMIIWGGENPGKFNDGKYYDPVTNTWSGSTTLVNAPSARSHLQAIWTGQEMILWGGSPGGVNLDTGAHYNPVTDSWVATSLTGAPEARSAHNMIWTGDTLIAWGGVNATTWINTGGLYKPFGPPQGAHTGHVTLTVTSGLAQSTDTITVQLTVTP